MKKQTIAAFRRGVGFTLVELMIVIAVIAVIAALLLPLLAAAKERGRETACISQLRQIGKAFQMYLDDYGKRPPRLDHLWSQYVSAKEIFVCPSDAWTHRGGWAWDAWGKRSTPPQTWPFPVSYGYFFSRDVSSPQWELAQSAPGRPGYVVCVLHGNRSIAAEPGSAPFFYGRTLRLCFSGAVIHRDIRYRKGFFNAWKLMTDQEDPPGAP